MRIRDKFKFLKKGKEKYNELKAVHNSNDVIAGMTLWDFMTKIRTDTEVTLSLMTDDELEMIFTDEHTKKLFKAIPHLKEKYDLEVEKRRKDTPSQ